MDFLFLILICIKATTKEINELSYTQPYHPNI